MYIKFDKKGEYGFYTPKMHGEEFCEDECIKITDSFYDYLLENNGKYLIDAENITDVLTEENLIERPIATIEADDIPTDQERLQALEQALLEMVLGGA